MDEDNLYEVKWCNELGRYLVAARDIKSREIIIREDPLVSGPTDRGPKEIPVCLGCCCVMVEHPDTRCTQCRWPVCNETCEKLPAHASNECQVFRENRVVYPPPNGWPYISKSIVILRCLLLKTNHPSKWELLMNMSDNQEIRRRKPKCINSDRKILENFSKFMPTHDKGNRNSICSQCQSPGCTDGTDKHGGFSETEVIQISGILDTNAHAFPLSLNGRSIFVCNLYSKTSLLAHSCHPNASWSPDKSLSSLTLTIRANVTIAKGDKISVAYDDGQLLVCTLKRLVPNEINGMFVCHCERCMDPTEFGTYLGAIKCPSCENGYLLPIDPVDSFSSWKCDNGGTNMSRQNSNDKTQSDLADTLSLSSSICSNSRGQDDRKGNRMVVRGAGNCDEVVDDETIVEMMEEAESVCGYTRINLASAGEPSSLQTGKEQEVEDVELLKEFVKEYSGSILHPNHYVLQEVNVRILKGDYAKGFASMSESDLILYLERCESLLEIANVLTPGFCEYRGLLALERRKEEANNQERQSQNKNDTIKCDEQGNSIYQNGIDENTTLNTERMVCPDFEKTSLENDASKTKVKVAMKEAVNENKKKFGNSKENFERLMEMLTYLFTFFQEINSEHKLLEPISDTIEDTELKLQAVQSE